MHECYFLVTDMYVFRRVCHSYGDASYWEDHSVPDFNIFINTGTLLMDDWYIGFFGKLLRIEIGRYCRPFSNSLDKRYLFHRSSHVVTYVWRLSRIRGLVEGQIGSGRLRKTLLPLQHSSQEQSLTFLSLKYFYLQGPTTRWNFLVFRNNIK